MSMKGGDRMNIDIVSAAARLSSATVNYGEPSPESVYLAAFKITMPAEEGKIAKDVIEQLPDNYWELLSLEHGVEQRPAKDWMGSELFLISPEFLHKEYEEALTAFRTEFSIAMRRKNRETA